MIQDIKEVKECPECGSDDVGVVLTGEEGKGAKNWECRKCKWSGLLFPMDVGRAKH